MIHEYIYVDIERVRSYFAQMSEGLPIEKVTQEEDEFGARGSARANLAVFGGEAEGSILYRRSSSETTSFHDHLVKIFLQRLRDENLLHDIDTENTAWSADFFRDGMFILVSGVIKAQDYNYLASRLENFPKLIKQINTLSQEPKAKPARNNGNINKIVNPFTSNWLKNLVDFMNQNTKDILHIKVYPYNRGPGEYFISTAESEHFRITPSSLARMYGTQIDANWSCLLQINQNNNVEKNNSSEKSHAQVSTPVQGNKLEAAFTTIDEALKKIDFVLQEVKFPNIAATPIVIYREISY